MLRSLIAVLLGFALNAIWAADESPGASFAKPYVLGTQDLPIPKLPMPERGKPFDDPTFGTKITRISDPSDGWGATMRRHGYSTHSPLNRDGTLLVLEGAGPWHVYDNKACKVVKEIPNAIGDISSPRWDMKDPNVCYFAEARSTRFMKFNVKTGEAAVVHDFKQDFPAMKWLAYHSYDDPSFDGRYWGFGIMDCAFWDERGKALAVVIYDMHEDKIAGQHAADHGAVVGISPSGKRILYGGESLKRDFTAPVKLGPDMGHADFALDGEGREVYVYQDNKTDFWTSQDLETGKQTQLIHQIHGCKDWNEYKLCSGVGVHFSGNCFATPGWAVVSTSGPRKEKDLWCSLCLYLLKLEPGDTQKPTVWRVAHTHCVKNHDPAAGQHYWAETHGTIDRFGKSVFFASNWDDFKAPLEEYRCDLPEGWYEKLMGADKAKETRAKAAKTLGISVDELVGGP
ncbi:MAG: hypothetical protein HY291_15500 [Planctomycetes bacterium]|nr:hypothetical protein [Planctomycetota bacterium]